MMPGQQALSARYEGEGEGDGLDRQLLATRRRVMIDDDDWMNPRGYTTYQSPPPKKGTWYQIQRKKATIVSGPSGMMHTWEVWREFETKKERDTELKKLRDEHPSWHLRGRSVTYINGQPHARDPFEYQDD